MDPIAEIELDEDILFDHHSSAAKDYIDDTSVVSASEGEAADLEGLEEEADFGAHCSGEPGADNSAKSSTLHVSLVDAEVHEAVQLRGRHIPASMPATSNVRMGSSMPIAVPHMARWKKETTAAGSESPQGPTAAYPGTFVPPHQMSHVNDNLMFSLNGDSPSFVKRERLKARNAILKSTGFLEPGVVSASTIGLQERNRLAVGGLSQALQQNSAAAAQ